MAKTPKVTRITLTKDKLVQILPAHSLIMKCPSELEDVKINFNEGSFLFVLPDGGFVFLIQAGVGKRRGNIQPTLQKFKKSAAAVILNSSQDITIVGKDLQETILVEDLTFVHLQKVMQNTTKIFYQSVLSREIDNNSEMANMDNNTLIERLKSLEPENAKDLEKYARQLIATGTTKNGQEVWEVLAKAALRLLPYALKNPAITNPVITTIARSIVFLPTGERLQALKTILDSAIDPTTNLETSERLSSVALAVAPSLNSIELVQMIAGLRSKLRLGEKIAPSLAQMFSLAFSRTPKQ